MTSIAPPEEGQGKRPAYVNVTCRACGWKTQELRATLDSLKAVLAETQAHCAETGHGHDVVITDGPRRPSYGDRVRVKCTGTGRYLGQYGGRHLALFVSAMDNSTCIDEVGEGEPQPSVPVPSDDALEAAATAYSSGYRQGRTDVKLAVTFANDPSRVRRGGE